MRMNIQLLPHAFPSNRRIEISVTLSNINRDQDIKEKKEEIYKVKSKLPIVEN